jgi:hypothetical protein
MPPFAEVTIKNKLTYLSLCVVSIGDKIRVNIIIKGGNRMQNYSKVGGILSIVAGGLGCLGSAGFVLLAILFSIFATGDVYYHDYYNSPDFTFNILGVVYAIIGVIGILVSVLAIVGGVYGLKKKHWGLALAGAIAGIFTFFPCGVVAVIFTAMGKPEFDTAPVVHT